MNTFLVIKMHKETHLLRRNGANCDLPTSQNVEALSNKFKCEIRHLFVREISN